MTNTKSFNIEFLKKFFRLFTILVRTKNFSNERIYSQPFIFIILILLINISLEFIIYYVGLLPSEFYVELKKKINERDPSIFRNLVFRSFLLVIIDAFLTALVNLLSSILYIRWRTRIILYLHSFYFIDQRYYHLINTTQSTKPNLINNQIRFRKNYSIQDDNESSDEVQFKQSNELMIDNPDQRIAQDADVFCRILSKILPLILISPFKIIYYTYRTWHVMGAYAPIIIILFYILSNCLNRIFISSISKSIFQQNIIEGNFRFLHTQIRIYNEPIAFYNGGVFEQQRFNNYFRKILTKILYRRSIQEYFLNFLINCYDYIGNILNYLLIALALFIFHLYDKTSLDDLILLISQTSFTTIYLIYCFSQLNDLADQLTIITANTYRIQTFIEYMKNILITPIKQQSNDDNQIVLKIENLSYSTPIDRQRILMKNLNLQLNKGQHLLITGASGVGKTSIFRILHSLWPINLTGSFIYNRNCSYLLPQRPYFTNQSLYNELTYPNIENQRTTIRQQQIEYLLNEWNLSHILDYVQSNVFQCPDYAWQDLLSTGELQRLSFLRLILRLSFNENINQIDNLNLIFLDEITSAVDIDTEIKMYKYLIQQNLTIISIAHRQTIRKYHRLELKLEQNGRYTIENIQRIN